MTSDVTIREEGRDLVMPTDNDYAMMSYEDLEAMETIRVSGFTIVSKEELLGVPHIATKVTYWHPLEGRFGFVSVEATVASAPVLKRAISRGWVPNVAADDQFRLEPSERIVYNDGGTGIRRQLTELFHGVGVIDVGHEDINDGSRFDTPWPDWEAFTDTRRQSAEIGEVPCVWRIPTDDKRWEGGYKPFVLKADRGLSVSEYSNAYTDDGRTFYLR